jgi:hypothetical protein
MNFLQLSQSLAVEAGISGTLSTVVGASGEMARVTGWINQAWNEIQLAHEEWRFMRSSVLLDAGASFTTEAGRAYYTLGVGAGKVGIADDSFGKWAPETFRNYTTAAGFTNEIPMEVIGFDAWREAYMLGANRNVQTRPVVVAIGPNMEVCLGPPPNALYTITADYYVAPTLMAADADVPALLPARYHMLIVYKALISKYGGYEAAPEVVQRGREQYAPLFNELEALYGPQLFAAGALA